MDVSQLLLDPHTHTTVSNFFSAEVDLKTREEIRWQGQDRLGKTFLCLGKHFSQKFDISLKYYQKYIIKTCGSLCKNLTKQIITKNLNCDIF